MYFKVLFSNTQKPDLNPAEGNTLFFWDFKPTPRWTWKITDLCPRKWWTIIPPYNHNYPTCLNEQPAANSMLACSSR